MDVLLAAGVPVDPSAHLGIKGVGDVAYELQTALLREHLGSGHSVVLDCGADADVRETWGRVAHQADTAFWLVDTVCSDVRLHRRRFEARGPVWRCDIGQTWDTVDELRKRFEPHPRAVFTADAIRPVEENVEAILTLVRPTEDPSLHPHQHPHP
jgi:predicted kinase